MYKLSTSIITRDVSPREVNEKFLPINNFPGQRPLNLKKVKLYAIGMESGSMRPVSIDVATGPNGIKYLMNGQHVCTAIVDFGKPFKASVSYWTCDTEDDLWKLFATFDTHASRTQSQIIKGARPFLKDPELHEMPIRLLSACGTALDIIKTPKPIFTKSLGDKSEKVSLIDSHSDEVLWINRFKEHDHLTKVGIIAAMIATARKNTARAVEFWELVATGVSIPTEKHPAYRLREKLKEGAKRPSGSAQHFELYCTCICWWNSFITGESRRSVKISSITEPPEVIASRK